MRILLALDGSPSSHAALEEVCRRPWPPGSEVRMITVLSPLELMILREQAHLPESHEDLPQQEGWGAVDQLDRSLQIVNERAPGLAVHAALLEGRPSEVILAEAERWGAELVVLGSRGFSAAKSVLLGSVSMAVALNAPCSVEIVRPAPDTLATVRQRSLHSPPPVAG